MIIVVTWVMNMIMKVVNFMITMTVKMRMVNGHADSEHVNNDQEL